MQVQHAGFRVVIVVCSVKQYQRPIIRMRRQVLP